MTGSAPTRRKSRQEVVPNQHGAWGFLVLPVGLGIAAGGWSWALVPFALAWVAAYPVSWALTGRLTARRPERFDRALVLWGAVALPAAAAAVVVRPWLAWVGAGYLGLYGVSLHFARQRNERALANDLVLVAQCTGVVGVVAGVASGERGLVPPWDAMLHGPVVLLELVCGLTLVGSTLHVKSLIRERNDPRYARASEVFALASVPVVLIAGIALDQVWLPVLPFVLLAARATVWRNPRSRPSRIGLVELGCLVAVLVAAAVRV